MNSKNISKILIQQLAPDELPLFEDMWNDFQDYGSIDSADTSNQSLGLGGATELSYISALVIPVVTLIGTQLLKNSVDAIFDYFKERLLKKKSTKFSDEELLKIANRIAEELKKN